MHLDAVILHEILLALTFVLTFFNVWNNVRNARRNSIANDPTISDIRISLAEILKDIAHVKQAADQKSLHKEIADLKAEVAELKASVKLLMQANGR